MNLDAVLDELVERIAQRVVDKLNAGDVPGLVDQARSPLGRRRHVAMIRSGKLPGKKVGRNWLARVEDVEALISNASIPAKPQERESSDDLARSLGIKFGR